MSKSTFLYNMSRADPDAFEDVLGGVYDFIEARAFGDELDEVAENLLFEMQNASRPKYDDNMHAGLDIKVDKVFSDMLKEIESSEAADDLRLKISLQLRHLRQIVSTGFAYEVPGHSYHVVGPIEDIFPYEKMSASWRAGDLRREYNISCREHLYEGGLDRARALIFEAPLSTAEIMLAGEAKAKGLQMVLIGSEELLPGVPTFSDPEDAFKDIIARCMHSSELTEDIPEEDLERSAVLEPSQPDDGDYAALALHAGILRTRCRNLVRSLTSRSDRDAARYAEMYKMIKSDMVPEEVRNAFFQITANGSRAGESPTAAQRINTMRHQIEKLEDRIEELQKPAEVNEAPTYEG
jgi:hypothetical protein